MVFAKAKSLIQTGTWFIGRLELRSRDAQFASNKSPGRQDIGGGAMGRKSRLFLKNKQARNRRSRGAQRAL